MLWRRRGTTGSNPVKQVSPRINMIVACDNSGRLYVAVTQCNTDADLYMLFMSKLVTILGKEDHHFRENILFVMDSASVHRDAATR